MRKWTWVVGACALLIGGCKNENNNYNPPGITSPTGPAAASVTSVTLTLSNSGGNNGANCTGFPGSFTASATAWNGATVVSTNPTDFDFLSSNTQVASVDANGHGTYTGAAGSADITAKYRGSNFSESSRVTVTTNACTTSNPKVLGVTVFPPNLTLKPGDQSQLSVSVQVQDNAPQTVTWSSTNIACATVSNTGLVNALQQVTQQCTTDIYATSTFDASMKSSSHVTVTPPQTQYGAITINPQNPNFTLSGTGGACTVSQPFTATQMVNNQSQTASGQWTLTGPNGITASATGSAFNFQTNVPGQYTLSLNANGVTGQINFPVGGSCGQQNAKPTISPTNPNVSVSLNNGICSGSQPFTAYLNGAQVSGTWRVTSGTGSFSGSTYNATGPGPVTIVVQVNGVDSDPLTFTVGGTCQPSQFITITPQNFGTLVVGGAGAQLNVSASGAYTLSVSTPCLQYTQSGNVVMVSAANCAAYQQNGSQPATITGALTGTSLTAQSSGTVTSGTVTCSGTINGAQVTQGQTFTVSKGQSLQLFTNCPNQTGATFTPLGRSSNTNEARISGSGSTTIAGQLWQLGPNFTITADNVAGTNGPARITIQHSLTDTGTLFSFFVNVVP